MRDILIIGDIAAAVIGGLIYAVGEESIGWVLAVVVGLYVLLVLVKFVKAAAK